MRFNEKSELHFAYPFSLVIDNKRLMERARENGAVTDSFVGIAVARQPVVSSRAKQWLMDHVGHEQIDWVNISSGSTLVFCFVRRKDAMFFKLVWG